MKKPIYTVAYTNGRERIVKTKKRATERMKVWKRWYERLGWEVRSAGDGYIAKPKGWSDDPSLPRHAIVIREYDAETKQRIHREAKTRPALKAHKADDESAPAPVRRGRSTPAWA